MTTKVTSVAVALSTVPLSAALAVDITAKLNIDLAAQPLETALVELSKQGRLQLVIATDSLPAKTSASLHGHMPLNVAFEELLKETGLTYKLVGEHTIAIVRAAPADSLPSRRSAGERSGQRHGIASESSAKQDDPKQRTLKWRLATSLGICWSHAGRACAKNMPTAHLEEIVVTARKREESLQNVPVAVTVVSRELLTNTLANDLTKFGELVPQVSLSQGGSGTGAVITVRGVSSGSNDAGLDQSVAIEIDDVPISRGQVISAAIFDVEQVQILQGPQALFFGKNTPAGVISLRSANPTERFEASVTSGYELVSDQRFADAVVSGPMTEKLKARLALRASKMDGWIRNVAEPLTDIIQPGVTNPGATAGDRGPAIRDYAGRLTLQWTPSHDFDVTLKWMKDRQHRNSGNATTEPFCIEPTIDPIITVNRVVYRLPGADCKRNRRKSHGSVAAEYAMNFPYANGGKPYFDSTLDLASLTFDKRFDAFALRATTGYYDQTVQQMSVSDWSPYASIFAASRERYTLWTQEARANTYFDGPVNLMLGAYYESFERPFSNAPDINHVFNPVAQNYMYVDMQSKTTGRYASGFAQVRWNIVPSLELAVGARYSHDEKKIRIENVNPNPALTSSVLAPGGRVLRSKFSDDNVSPEATLIWHPRDEHTLYAAYKTGYKGGGLSNNFLVAPSATPDNIRFKPEKAEGFEIGYKATMSDRRLRVDANAYRYNYDDLQVASYNAATITFTVNNAAAARIKGVQGSVQWLATNDLTLQASFGYNRARYRSYRNAQCYAGQTAAQGCIGVGATSAYQDLSGKALLRAPELTYSLGANYRIPLIQGWNTSLSVHASHSDAFETATDYAPGGHQRSFWLLNAGIHVGPDDGKYEVAVIGRNLTDSYYMLNVVGWSNSGNPNQYVGFFNRPREVVLQATARF